ncbi:hypothetical protein VZT92_009807 [Zoarces viviparus]|uniref:Uncharacterized protein n=1 Tax=Zoarces viviparus TaxID=48416 RepID=A0AAW1FEC0_ZOAVI
MSLLILVFVALLASTTAQSGIPRYIQGRWVITEDNPQYEEDTDDQLLTVNERIWPESPPEVIEVVTEEDQTLLTTPEPYAKTEQVDDPKGGGSSVWKIVLVVVVLLVSVVGSLSVAYYMCFWRGGRIHYRPQKADYA